MKNRSSIFINSVAVSYTHLKRYSLLFALFIFLSSLSMQAEETAGKWSERYNVTAITMDEGLPQDVYKRQVKIDMYPDQTLNK